MQHVQVEVHKGIAEVTKLDPGIEVELVDLDVKSVVRFTRKGDGIDWQIVTPEEETAEEEVSHE